MDVSICIVNYNTAELTKRCIQSVLDNISNIMFEIIVVDNASTDDSIKIFEEEFEKKIILIKNPTNRYFTGGYNDAAFKAKGKYLLFLNSDGYIKDNSIKIMFEFLEKNQDVGAVEGTIIDEESGIITKTSSSEYTKKISFFKDTPIINFLSHKVFPFLLKNYYYSDWDRKIDREVEVICNAFMLIRKNLFIELGGFNEALKLYYTENYLCDLIRRKGFKLFHLAKPKMYHRWSSSIKKINRKFINTIFKTDRKIYFVLKEMR